MSSDLSVLFPQPREMLVGDQVVNISAVTFQDFEAFGASASKAIAFISDPTPLQLMQAAANGMTDALLSLVLTCTDLSKERALLLPASVILQIASEVIVENSDFFGQALLHVESRLVGALQSND